MKIRIPRWIILFILFTAWVVVVTKIPSDSLLYPLLFAPVIEELIFRFAFLEIVLSNKYMARCKWMFVILMAGLFGAVHSHQNMFLVQGVMGFILGYIYIHNRAKSITQALIVVIIFHALWNTFCVYGLKYLI